MSFTSFFRVKQAIITTIWIKIRKLYRYITKKIYIYIYTIQFIAAIHSTASRRSRDQRSKRSRTPQAVLVVTARRKLWMQQKASKEFLIYGQLQKEMKKPGDTCTVDKRVSRLWDKEITDQYTLRWSSLINSWLYWHKWLEVFVYFAGYLI